MKIYNQDKTAELTADELNMELGHLIADKLFVAHHDATPFVAGKTAAERAADLTAQGETVEQYASQPGKYYIVKAVYDNGGKEVEEIQPAPDKPAVDAYDEYEDIQVYIPYTADELQARKITALRERRKSLLEAFDKWEKAVLRGRETDDKTVMMWYRSLLDLEESAFDAVPERVKYYM